MIPYVSLGTTLSSQTKSDTSSLDSTATCAVKSEENFKTTFNKVKSRISDESYSSADASLEDYERHVSAYNLAAYALDNCPAAQASAECSDNSPVDSCLQKTDCCTQNLGTICNHDVLLDNLGDQLIDDIKTLGSNETTEEANKTITDQANQIKDLQNPTMEKLREYTVSYINQFNKSITCSDIGQDWAPCNSANPLVKCCVNHSGMSDLDTPATTCKNSGGIFRQVGDDSSEQIKYGMCLFNAIPYDSFSTQMSIGPSDKMDRSKSCVPTELGSIDTFADRYTDCKDHTSKYHCENAGCSWATVRRYDPSNSLYDIDTTLYT